jgi:c-di-GMP-binding flagellar brake protein YcgR
MKIDFVFLLKAISDSENISICLEQNDETYRYFSRFFKVLSNEDSMIIDYPFADGFTHKPLEENNPVTVYFHSAGFRFQFDSVVKDSTSFTLGDGTRIPALKLAWPDKILDGNRRSLFRITAHLDKAIFVKYYILGNVMDKGKSFAGAEQVEYEGIEAIMIDISENGIAVEIKRKINIDTGDILKLMFRLEEEDNKEIEIEGIVRNIRELPQSDIHICGIEFTPDKTSTYRKSLQKIVRYIMARNREHISFFKVNKTVSRNPFVQKIVDNEVTEEFLYLLLLKKLPLTDEEYLESLVYVLKIEKFKTKARQALKVVMPSIKETYIQRSDANHRVAYYLLNEAIDIPNLKIIAGVVNNPHFPEEFLLTIAEKGTAAMLRILAANTFKLIAYPEIMDTMEDNPAINLSIKQRIQDIRIGHIQKQEAESIPEAAVIDGVADFVSILEKERKDKDKPVKVEEVKKDALSSLQKINRLSFQERIKLAFSGSKPERIILAKDTNKFVVQAVVESPKTTEDEMKIIARNKNVPKEVIARICENKHWIGNYSIMFTLLRNPNFPAKKAMDYLKQLRPRDLHQLVGDKSANPAVRDLARYFYTKKK